MPWVRMFYVHAHWAQYYIMIISLAAATERSQPETTTPTPAAVQRASLKDALMTKLAAVEKPQARVSVRSASISKYAGMYLESSSKKEREEKRKEMTASDSKGVTAQYRPTVAVASAVMKKQMLARRLDEEEDQSLELNLLDMEVSW